MAQAVTFNDATDADASFADAMVAALQTALTSGAGIRSVTVDGTTTVFETRAEMRAELAYWRREVARESGTKPRVATINLGTA